MSHTCHAADCSREVQPEFLMCGRHWRMVPRDLQARVWATYRPGQCDDWQPSAGYCDAAKAAVIAVAEREGKTLNPDHPAVLLYDIFRPKEDNQRGELSNMPRATKAETATAPAQAAAPMVPPGVAAATHAAAGGPAGVRRASFDPDKMVQTGLPSKFNGMIAFMSYLPRKFGEKSGKKAGLWGLACEINIIPDDQSLAAHQIVMPDGTRVGVVREVLGVDDLNQWVPSMDGVNPAGADLQSYLNLHGGAAMADEFIDACRGFYLVPGAQNSREGTKKGTKWHQWTEALKKAKVPNQVYMGAEDLRVLVGLYGHWIREEFHFKGNKTPDLSGGEKEQTNDTLVLVEFMQMRAAGASVASVQAQAAMPAAAPAAPAPQLQAPPQMAPAPAQTPTPAVSAAPSAGAPSNPAAAGLAPLVEQFILTKLHEQKAANPTPPGLTAGTLMSDVFTHFQANGGQGALAITLLNDSVWLFGEDRMYWTIPHKGILALTEEDAQRLSA